MSPKLTGSQWEEIVRRYPAGKSANSLAPRFGVHVSTVLTHLRRAGLDPRWGGVIDGLDIEAAGSVAAKLSPAEFEGYIARLVGIAQAMAEASPDKGEQMKVSPAEAETVAEIERRL